MKSADHEKKQTDLLKRLNMGHANGFDSYGHRADNKATARGV